MFPMSRLFSIDSAISGVENIVRYNEDYAIQTFAILMPHFIYPVFFYTTSFLSLD